MKPPKRRTVLRVAVTTSAVLLMVGVVVSWFVAGNLVAPCPRLVGDPPADLNAVAFQVESDSGSLISGWRTRPTSDSDVATDLDAPPVRPSPTVKGVIVLLHGIRGSRLSMLNRARILHAAGYSTVMIDFQAHGESPGGVITAGHLERHDARAAVQYARHAYAGKPIGVIGVSLGGAAALLASPLEVDAMVLESVYPNIRDAVHHRVAARLGAAGAIPASILLLQLRPRLGVSEDELRPIDHLAEIGCPVLVMGGREDRHTTEAETINMFSVATEPKHLWLVDDAAHEDLLEVDARRYQQQVVGFFDHYLGEKEGPSVDPAWPR